MAVKSAAGSLLAALLLLATAPAAQAAGWAEVLPFPLAGSSTTEGARLAPVPAVLARLASLRRVTLADVALPGGGPVALELQRVDVAADGAILAVNGAARPQAALDEGLTLWTGRVAGDPQSDVFLAFSAEGSRGWVRHAGQLQHLTAQPDAQGRWTSGSSSWWSEQALRAAGAQPAAPCGTAAIAQPFATGTPRVALAGPGDSSPLPLLECRVALETDFQYYQLFNDLDAARTYALSLFGAISSRYREQVGVIITLPYLGLYTSNSDPWTSQDQGGNSIDVLYEFQAGWGAAFGGTAPVPATVYHLISGASLGGGVAYLDVLCNPDYAFGVTGNLGGATPFPVVPAGTLNWDFVATAHEIGHNFNALHTHDYCPPLDECAPPGYFGGCQMAQNCTTQGTVMSYCHLCSGGFLNETTYFHPQSAADMRAAALLSCMQPYKGVTSSDLGYAKPGSNGIPALEVSFTPSPDTLLLAVTSAPKNRPGTLFLALNQALLPFKGGTLVPAPTLLIGVASNAAGALNLPLGVAFSFPDGIQLYTQAWFQDNGGNVAATNALFFELITP